MSDIYRINRRRKTVRKWMLVAIIPVALAVVLYGVKVISMDQFASNAASSYADGDMTTAQQNAGRLKFANWFEPWKAFFNNGTTLLALGSYDLATPDLKKAVELFEEDKDLEDKEVKETSCLIRGNLAISYEGLGDNLVTDKKFDEAQEAYDSAKKVLENCDDESSQETKERLDGKGDTTEPPQEPEPTDEEIEDIQDQLDSNNEERQDEESADPSNTNGDFDNGGDTTSPDPVDKPW